MAVSSSTAVPAPTLAVVPAPTPLPSPLLNGGLELIGRAYDALLDYAIDPPAPRSLLDAAWREATAEVRRLGAEPQEADPLPASGREEIWEAFQASYVALVVRLSEDQARSVRFAALGGMARSVNDCHTFYLPPTRSEALEELRSGRGSVGVGIEIAPVRPPYVREAVAGSPAARAGVRAGDQLLDVDGIDVTVLGAEMINDLLRGEPGSTVSVVVGRPPTGAAFAFSLDRAVVRPPAAEGRVVGNGIGYLRLRVFTSGTSLREQVDEIIAGFEAGEVRAWIIDLRDNPGGDRDLVLDGRFIGDEIAERTLLRDGGLEITDAEGEPYPQRPVAVLTNSGTASVAEIFAAMLQDQRRARVFGTTTARCAGFVSLQQFPDGSTLGVTIAQSLTPRTALPLYRTGVLPDEVLRQTADDLAAGRDPVLDRAAAWLATQTR